MRKYLFIAALAALALTSCQQEKDIDVNKVPAGENNVSFVLQSGAPTRSGDVVSPVRKGFSVEIGQVDNQAIYLEETITDLGYSEPETKGTPLYTENLPYLYRDKMSVHTSTYSGGDVTYYQIGNDQPIKDFWCYGYDYPTNIWGNMTTDKVDFAFRMPSSMTSSGVSSLSFTGNTTSFKYTSPGTAEETQDIVFGGITKSYQEYKSDYKQFGGSKVMLYHALTGVKFAIANPKKNGKLEYDIQIKEISFIGLANGGNCTFTPGSDGLGGGDITWTKTTTEEGNVISQTFSANDLVDYAKPTTGEDPNHFADEFYAGGVKQNINDTKASKTFWLVPQVITGSDAILKIKYDMNGKTDQYLEIRLGDLHASNWEEAQLRTYTFKLDEVNVKIEDTITMAEASLQEINTPWGKKNVTSYAGSTKQDVVITNTGNCDAFIRAAIIGQWRDSNGNPVFGFTDFTHGVQLVDSWYEDVIVKKTNVQGEFTGLPGSNWVLGDDGYYYYTKAVPAGQAIPDALFTKYEVKKTPGAAIAGAVQEIYFTLEIATQAISAKKLDGNNYSYTEAWTRANSFVE
ncbi:MAG: hypothetical protein J6P69_06855 [Bacteroidales bacterium]|nr:hypothetical protein [Bacteroidales bacterium]